MTEQFFCLEGTEDGVIFSKIENINEFLKDAVDEEITFLSDFPETPWDDSRKKFTNESSCCDGKEKIIIKGSIVCPEIKKVVTQYKL